jgi:hypothetical protein
MPERPAWTNLGKTLLMNNSPVGGGDADKKETHSGSG